MQNKKIMKAVLIAGLCFTSLGLPVTASNSVDNINTETMNEDEINFL